MDISTFNFKTMTETDYADLKPFFSLRPTLCCESHFTYHILWSDYYQTKYYQHPNGILWLQQVDYDAVACIPPICSITDLRMNFTILEQYYNQVLNQKLIMYLVDEEALAELKPLLSNYTIVEDRDSFDYIYDAEQLRNLSGRKYAKRKNDISFFLRNYGNRYEYRDLSASNADEILAFLDVWLQSKEDEDPLHRLNSEDTGLKHVLNALSISEARIAGIYIDGILSAFSLGTYDPVTQTVVIHVEKTLRINRGLNPFLSQQFLIRTFPEARYVNREDDMGIPQLRHAKEEYHPIQYAKKYTLYQH